MTSSLFSQRRAFRGLFWLVKRDKSFILLASAFYGSAYAASAELLLAGAASGVGLDLISDLISLVTNVIFTAVVYAYATTNNGSRLSLAFSMTVYKPPRIFVIAAMVLFAISIGFSLLALVAIAVIGLLGSALPLSFIEGFPPFQAIGESVKRTSQFFLSIFGFNFLVYAPLFLVLLFLTGVLNDLLSGSQLRTVSLGTLYGFGIAALIYAQSAIYRELVFIEAETREGRLS